MLACLALLVPSFGVNCGEYLCAKPKRPRVPPVWIITTLASLSPQHRSRVCSQAASVLHWIQQDTSLLRNLVAYCDFTIQHLAKSEGKGERY
uniref:Secreted protein n=1 Tax=Arundo donax TaxID=35708 RepID=A0A0A8XVZ2_ARUDO